MKISKTLSLSYKKNFSPYSPMDIGSKCKYPLDILSNFTKTDIQYDNVQINSIEGFLQSLKTPDVDEQKRICSLIGFPAKKAGIKLKKKNIFDNEHLHWQGKTFLRDSEEYKNMLKEIFSLKYMKDLKFRNALNKTGEHRLTHSIGKNDSSQTILTTDEFISLLTSLRNTKEVSRIDRFKLSAERIYENTRKMLSK